ncbi:MAG: hypothetical protein ABIJ45_03135, partial [Candidatus Zixiibacteriota bacterium]
MNNVLKMLPLYAFLILIISAPNIMGQDIYDIAISQDNTGADQINPRIAVSKSGTFAVVWSDKRSEQIDIYFQLVDSTGTLLSTNKKLIDSPSGIPEFEPSVDANYSAQFVATWRDFRNGAYPLYPDIYFSRIDTTQTPENINVTSGLDEPNCEAPDIAMFVDGSSIAVWSDYRNNQWDIYGQIVSPEGILVGSAFKINSDIGSNQQHSPRVATFRNDGFVVVWKDDRNGNDDIYYQRYNSSATAIGLNQKVNDDAGTSIQAFPAVCADGKGRFFISWVDWRNGRYPSNPDIYMRRYDSSGIAYSASINVVPGDGGRAQRDVSIASDRMGNICIVFADSTNSQWDAKGQIFDCNGSRDGTIFLLHETSTGRQRQPDVTADGYKFYFVWADYREGNYDIYATIMDYNNPTIIGEPNQLNFTMDENGSLPDDKAVILTNAGFGELNWSTFSTVDWLAALPVSGTTPDTIVVSILDESLTHGTYYGEIVLVNQTNGDSTEAISVMLTVATGDTVKFLDGNAFLSSTGSIPVSLNLKQNSLGGYIPFSYDSATATLDSIVPDYSGFPDYINFHLRTNNPGFGEVGFYTNSSFGTDSVIEIGEYDLATLYFTTGDIDDINTISVKASDSSDAYILDSLGIKARPTVIPGNLYIGSPLDVDDNPADLIPDRIEVSQ